MNSVPTKSQVESINVPRDEIERLVKLLQYQAHPYPSPHAKYWQGLLDQPGIDGRSVQRFWASEAQNIRCVREEDYDALLTELARVRRDPCKMIIGDELP